MAMESSFILTIDAREAIKALTDIRAIISGTGKSAQTTEESISELSKNSSSDFKSMGKETRKLGEEFEKLSKEGIDSLGALEKATSKVGDGFKVTFGEIAAAGVAGFGFTELIMSAGEFEKQMNAVAAITDLDLNTESGIASLKQLSQAARKAGSETQFSALEAAKALEFEASAGWSVQEQITGLIPIINASVATNTDLATTAEIVTDSLNAFGLPVSEATQLIDTYAKTASLASTDLRQIGEAGKYAAPALKLASQSAATMSAVLGIVAANGLKAGSAGTGTADAITSLIKPSGEAAKIMERLHLTISDSTGKVRDYVDISEELNKTFSDYSEVDKATMIFKLFGAEGGRIMAALIDKSKVYRDEQGNLTSEFRTFRDTVETQRGTAAKMGETMGAGFIPALDNAGGALEELGLTMMDDILPIATQLVVSFTNVVAAVTPIATAFKPLIEIVSVGGSLMLGMKAVAMASTVATGASTAFGLAVLRFSAAAGSGASALTVMNTALWGTSAAAAVSGSSMAKLQAAGQMMFAAWAGYEFGTYLFNQFEVVRYVGYEFVGSMEKGFISIQYYTEVTGTIIKGVFNSAIDDASSAFATGIAAIEKGILGISSVFSLVVGMGTSTLNSMISWVESKMGGMLSGIAGAMSYVDFVPGMEGVSEKIKSVSDALKSSSETIDATNNTVKESINSVSKEYEKQSKIIDQNKEAILSSGGKDDTRTKDITDKVSKLTIEFEKNKQAVRSNVEELQALDETNNNTAASTKKVVEAKAEITKSLKGEAEAEKAQKEAQKAAKKAEADAKKAASDQIKSEKHDLTENADAINENANSLKEQAKAYQESAGEIGKYIEKLKTSYTPLVSARDELAKSGMNESQQSLFESVKTLGEVYGNQVAQVKTLAAANKELTSSQLEQKKITLELGVRKSLAGARKEDIDLEVKYAKMRVDLSQKYSATIAEELIQNERKVDSSKNEITALEKQAETQKKLKESKDLLAQSDLSSTEKEYLAILKDVGVEVGSQIIKNQALAKARMAGNEKLNNLKEEKKLLGMTSTEKVKYDLTKDVAPEQKKAILAQAAFNEQIKESNDRLDAVGQVAGDFFEKFSQGAISGKEGLKKLGNELRALAQKEMMKGARKQLQSVAEKTPEQKSLDNSVNESLDKAKQFVEKNVDKIQVSGKDYSGTISSATKSAAETIGKSVTDLANKINEQMQQQAELIAKSETLNKQAEALGEIAGEMRDSSRNVGYSSGGSGGDGGYQGTVSSGNRRVGFISEKYEVGKGGAATISTGVGDKGGKSYGSWQLASKVGTLGSFLNSPEAAPFASMLKSAKLASSEFDQIWKNLAKTQHDSFEGAQHAFIQRTHYEPAAKFAAAKGFDMSNDAIKNVIWSGSVQHGGVKNIIANVAKYHQSALGNVDETIKAFYEERTKYWKAGKSRYDREEKDALAYSNELKKGGTAINKSISEDSKSLEKASNKQAEAATNAAKATEAQVNAAKVQAKSAETQAKSTENHAKVVETQTKSIEGQVSVQDSLIKAQADVSSIKVEAVKQELLTDQEYQAAINAVEAKKIQTEQIDTQVTLQHAQATQDSANAVVAVAAGTMNAANSLPPLQGGVAGDTAGAEGGMYDKLVSYMGGGQKGGKSQGMMDTLSGWFTGASAQKTFGLDVVKKKMGLESSDSLGITDILGDNISDLTGNIETMMGSAGGIQALSIGTDLINGEFENAAVSAASLAASMTPLGPLGGMAVSTLANLAGVGAQFVRESEWTIASIKGTSGEFLKGFKEVKEGALGGERYGEEALDKAKIKALEEFLGQTTKIIEDTAERIGVGNQGLKSTLDETRAYISGMGAHDEEWFDEKMMESRVRAMKDYVSSIMIAGIDDATNQTQTEAVASTVAPKIASIMDQVVSGTFDEAIRASSWSGDLDFGELSGRGDISSGEMKAKLEQSMNDYIAATDFSSMDTTALAGNIGTKLKETFSSLGINDIPQSTFDDMSSIIGGRIQNSLEFITKGTGDSIVIEDIDFYKTFKKMTSEFQGTDEELSKFIDGMLNLKDTFKQSGINTGAITESFIESAGGLEKLSSSASTFKDKFVSESTAQAAATQGSIGKITSALSSANLVLPSSRDGFAALVQGLSKAGSESEQALAKLINASGSFDVFYTAVESFQKNFLKIPEGLENVDKPVSDFVDQITSLGVPIPKTREAFAQLVNGLDVTNKAESALYTSLIGISPVADQVYSSMEALGSGMSEHNSILLGYKASFSEVSTIFTDLGVAIPNSSNEFLALINSIDLTSESGRTLYANLMEATPAITSMYNAAKQLFSVDVSSVSGALQKAMESGNAKDAGTTFYSSFMDDLQSKFLSSTLDSVSRIIMDSVVTPMVNSSIQQANNLTTASVGVGTNLVTAGMDVGANLSTAGVGVGTNLATAGVNVGTNLATAGAVSAANIAMGSAEAGQQMVQGGNIAGQELVHGGFISAQAMEVAIESAKEIMLMNAEIMQAVKSDTNFQTQMESLGSTVFSGTQGTSGFQPQLFTPSTSQTNDSSGSSSDNNSSDSSSDSNDAAKAAEDASAAIKDLKKNLSDLSSGLTGNALELKNLTSSYSNTSIAQRIAGKSVIQLATEWQNISDADISDIAVKSGKSVKDLTADMQSYLKIQQEAEKARKDFNSDIEEQLKTIGMSEEQLKAYNQENEYQKMVDGAIEAGGNVAAVEELISAKRSKTAQDFNNDIQEQLKTIGMSEEQLKAYNQENEYQKMVTSAIEAGGDVVAVEELIAMKRKNSYEEQQKNISSFEEKFKAQIADVGKSAEQLDLEKLAVEFSDALEQAQELGADTIIVTQSFEQQRAEIIKKYANENSEAIKSIQDSVLGMSTLKSANTEQNAISTGSKYGIDIKSVASTVDMQAVINEAVGYSEEQWTTFIKNVTGKMDIDASDITNFKNELISTAETVMQLQTQFLTLRANLQDIAGVSTESNRNLVALGNQMPKLGLEIKGTSVAFNGVVMDSKQLSKALLGIMDNPLEFAQLATDLGFSSQESFTDAINTVTTGMKDMEQRSSELDNVMTGLHDSMEEIKNPITGAQKTLMDLENEFSGFGIVSIATKTSAKDVATAIESIPMETLQATAAQYGMTVDQLTGKIISGVQAMSQIQGQVIAFQQQQADAASGMSDSEIALEKIKEKYKEFPEIVSMISKKGLTANDVRNYVVGQSAEQLAALSGASGYGVEAIMEDVNTLESALDGINSAQKEISTATTGLKETLSVMAGETDSTTLSLEKFKNKYPDLINTLGLGSASVDTLNLKLGGLSDKQFEKYAKKAGVATTELVSDIQGFSESVKSVADASAEKTGKIMGFRDGMEKMASTLDDADYSIQKISKTSPELTKYLNSLGSSSYEISAALSTMKVEKLGELTDVAKGMGSSVDDIITQSNDYLGALRSKEEKEAQERKDALENRAQEEKNALEKKSQEEKDALDAAKAASEEQQKVFEQQQEELQKQVEERQKLYEQEQEELMKSVDKFFSSFNDLSQKIKDTSSSIAESIKSFYTEEQLASLRNEKMTGLASNIKKPRAVVDISNISSTEKLLSDIDEYQKLLVESTNEKITGITKEMELAKSAHEKETEFYSSLAESIKSVMDSSKTMVDELAKELGISGETTSQLRDKLLDQFGSETDLAKKAEIAKQIPIAIDAALKEEIAFADERQQIYEKLSQNIAKARDTGKTVKEKITGTESSATEKFSSILENLKPGMAASEENIQSITDAQNLAYDAYREQIEKQKELEKGKFEESKKYLESEKKGIEELFKQAEDFKNAFLEIRKEGATDLQLLTYAQQEFNDVVAKYQSGDRSTETLNKLKTAGKEYVQAGSKVYGSMAQQTADGGIQQTVEKVFTDVGASLLGEAAVKSTNLPLDETITAENIASIKNIEDTAAISTLEKLSYLDSILTGMSLQPAATPLPEGQINDLKMAAYEQLNAFNTQLGALNLVATAQAEKVFDDTPFALSIQETQTATVNELKNLGLLTMQLEQESKASLTEQLMGINDKLSPENQAKVAMQLSDSLGLIMTGALKELGLKLNEIQTTQVSAQAIIKTQMDATLAESQSAKQALAQAKIDFATKPTSLDAIKQSTNVVSLLPATTHEAPLDKFGRKMNDTVMMNPKSQSMDITKLNIPKLAEGGIVNSPTFAEIGEGTDPEAIIPLSKFSEVIQNYLPAQGVQNNQEMVALLRQLISILNVKGNSNSGNELLKQILSSIQQLTNETKENSIKQVRIIEEKKRA